METKPDCESFALNYEFLRSGLITQRIVSVSFSQVSLPEFRPAKRGTECWISRRGNRRQYPPTSQRLTSILTIQKLIKRRPKLSRSGFNKLRSSQKPENDADAP